MLKVGRKLRDYLLPHLIFTERHLRLSENKWFGTKCELNFPQITVRGYPTSVSHHRPREDRRAVRSSQEIERVLALGSGLSWAGLEVSTKHTSVQSSWSERSSSLEWREKRELFYCYPLPPLPPASSTAPRLLLVTDHLAFSVSNRSCLTPQYSCSRSWNYLFLSSWLLFFAVSHLSLLHHHMIQLNP